MAKADPFHRENQAAAQAILWQRRKFINVGDDATLNITTGINLKEQGQGVIMHAVNGLTNGLLVTVGPVRKPELAGNHGRLAE